MKDTKRIKIKIIEEGCSPCNTSNLEAPKQSDCAPPPSNHKNATNGQESRLHRTTLAHLMADTTVLLDLIQDEDDLPEWVEAKITKAGDYMSSVARYISGNLARDHGQL